MAKVKNPFMSLSASGTVGGVLTMAPAGKLHIAKKTPKSKPRHNINRQMATNALLIANECTHWAYSQVVAGSPDAETFAEMIQPITTHGLGWNQFFTRAIIGNNGASIIAADDARAAWTDTEHEAWDYAAQALNPPIRDVRQVPLSKGTPAQPIDAGTVYHICEWGLHVMGLRPRPGDMPPAVP